MACSLEKGPYGSASREKKKRDGLRRSRDLILKDLRFDSNSDGKP